MNSYLIVNCNNLQLVNKKYLTGGEVLFYFIIFIILLIFFIYNDSILLDFYIYNMEEKI